MLVFFIYSPAKKHLRSIFFTQVTNKNLYSINPIFIYLLLIKKGSR